MDAALIHDGVVVQVTRDAKTLPEGWTAFANERPVCGQLWDGESLTNPAPQATIPDQVTMFQARTALIGVGLFDAVDAYCKAEGGVTVQAWEYANHCYRHGALVEGLAPSFGLTSEQLDALFVQAAQIEA